MPLYFFYIFMLLPPAEQSTLLRYMLAVKPPVCVSISLFQFLQDLTYWFYLLVNLYISHWKETISIRMFLKDLTQLQLKTPKKSSQKNNSRMQCSVPGVLPSSKVLVRRFFPQGKTKGFFWFFHAAVWH